jgi:hypothetical protein
MIIKAEAVFAERQNLFNRWADDKEQGVNCDIKSSPDLFIGESVELVRIGLQTAHS